MRSFPMLAAFGCLALDAMAAETTLVCRGRVVESTMEGQKPGDISMDTMSIDDERRTVTANGASQPLSKFSAEAIEITKAGPKAKATISVNRVTGAYALRIIGVDSALRLIIGGECRDPTAKPAARQGSVTNSVYSNPSVGIGMKIARGWDWKSEFMQKRLAGLPDEVARSTLLTVVKMVNDSPRGMALLASEKLVDGLTAKDYVEAGRRVSQKRPGVTSVSEVKTETIAGLPYATHTVASGSGDAEVRVKSFARVHKGNVILYMLTTTGSSLMSSRENYEAEQMLASIEYK